MNMFTSQSFGKDDLIHWIPRIIIVIIIGQTLPFKFSGAEESVQIFTQLNMEPYGRIGIAIIESAAVILLMSRFYVMGAIMSLSLISAANFLHFAKLGLVINNDGGLLFFLSIIVIVCSLWTLIYWNKLKKKKKRVRFDFSDSSEIE
ncbi:MAG: DoxX family protein [Cyclobacteriaceae bacterium]